MDLPNLTGPDDTQLGVFLSLIASGVFGTEFFA